MPTPTDEDARDRGRLAASISSAVVHVFTERTVHAFMSANHTEPDAAAEIFLLDGEAPAVGLAS